MQTGIDYFSTATDYTRSAANFFLNVFDFGATAYQTVRDRVRTINEPMKIVEPEKESIFSGLFKDKDKVLAVIAVAVLTGGLIYAARR